MPSAFTLQLRGSIFCQEINSGDIEVLYGKEGGQYQDPKYFKTWFMCRGNLVTNVIVFLFAHGTKQNYKHIFEQFYTLNRGRSCETEALTQVWIV